jgi:hypothetical protein
VTPGGAPRARTGHDCQAGCPELGFVLKYRRERTENPYADQVHAGVRGRRLSEVNELLGGRNDA